MVPSQFSSRIAVVTGANKGIGYFIALQLGLSGLFTDVIIGCRDSSRGRMASEEMQQKINGTSGCSSKIHSFPLVIGDAQSHTDFCKRLELEFGCASVLVNNAGFAFKNSDPTPFEEQTKKTLETNYYGLIDFTKKMIPLLKKGTDQRIVNVASMAGRIKQLSSPALQAKFTDPQLTIEQLNSLMKSFENDVHAGVHRQQGWSNSNYGMSKLGVIAATKVLAREEPNISVNSCCPGFCDTDMTSNMGRRSPEDGARNAVIPATLKTPPTGKHFADYEVSTW